MLISYPYLNYVLVQILIDKAISVSAPPSKLGGVICVSDKEREITMNKNTTNSPKININFSIHAKERKAERKLSENAIQDSLNKCSYYLNSNSDLSKDIVVVNEDSKHSIVLNIKFRNGTYILKVITVMNFVPKTPDGHYKFYNYSELIFV